MVHCTFYAILIERPPNVNNIPPLSYPGVVDLLPHLERREGNHRQRDKRPHIQSVVLRVRVNWGAQSVLVH